MTMATIITNSSNSSIESSTGNISTSSTFTISSMLGNKKKRKFETTNSSNDNNNNNNDDDHKCDENSNDGNNNNADDDKCRNKNSNKKAKKLPTLFVPTILHCGQEYKVGDTRFILSKTRGSIHLYKMKDYNIITNEPINDFDLKNKVPESMKPLLESRWYYALHVSYGMAVSINRSILRARITGGEILAYKYTECSIEGNECVYYGFIPTLLPKQSKPLASFSTKKQQCKRNSVSKKLNCSYGNNINNDTSTIINNNTFEGTHRICRIATNSVWPRKLYIHLTREYVCSCSENCWIWTVRLGDYRTVQKYCFKKIPWSELYVIMGENDSQCLEQLKIARACVVCAQCFDCANSTAFCRRHKNCKHKRAIFFEDSTTDINNKTLIADSKIKSCIKF